MKKNNLIINLLIIVFCINASAIYATTEVVSLGLNDLIEIVGSDYTNDMDIEWQIDIGQNTLVELSVDIHIEGWGYDYVKFVSVKEDGTETEPFLVVGYDEEVYDGQYNDIIQSTEYTGKINVYFVSDYTWSYSDNGHDDNDEEFGGITVSYSSGAEASYNYQFSYDESGNRTSREYLTISEGSGEKAARISYELKDAVDQENMGDGVLKIYPNPTTGLVYVQLEDSKEKFKKITVYNLAGKIITSHQTKGRTQELDISDEVAGAYLVLIATNSKTVVRKIIKK